MKLATLTNEDLIVLRANLEVEMRRRKLAFSVGDIGEGLVIEYFLKKPTLPKLQLAPKGTKNVDALSRSGERFSIKTILNAKKTGTIYPDATDEAKQLFEFILIVKLSETLSLSSIHQIPWKKFVELRAWDKRMNAWYLPCSKAILSSKFSIMQATSQG